MHLLKPALDWVEVWAVRRHGEPLHGNGLTEPTTATRPGTVPHDEQILAGVGVLELLEKDRRAYPVQVRHVQAEALARGGFHSGIEPEPLVAAVYRVGQAPEAHQRRRCHTLGPTRDSSTAKTRRPGTA